MIWSSKKLSKTTIDSFPIAKETIETSVKIITLLVFVSLVYSPNIDLVKRNYVQLWTRRTSQIACCSKLTFLSIKSKFRSNTHQVTPYTN